MANIKETPGDKVKAQFLRYVKKDAKKQRKYLPKNKSVKPVSGGIPD